MWKTLVDKKAKAYDDDPNFSFTNSTLESVGLSRNIAGGGKQYIRIYCRNTKNEVPDFSGVWCHNTVPNSLSSSIGTYGEIFGSEVYPDNFGSDEYDELLVRLCKLYGRNPLTVNALHCLEHWREDVPGPGILYECDKGFNKPAGNWT